jgi:hypothetical protein
MLTAKRSSVPPEAGAACWAGSLNFCRLDTARGCCENAYDVSVAPACGGAAAVPTIVNCFENPGSNRLYSREEDQEKTAMGKLWLQNVYSKVILSALIEISLESGLDYLLINVSSTDKQSRW